MNTPDFLPILSHGNHPAGPETGACVMEMVSFLAGEEWTDKPACVSIAIRREAISINDLVSDDNRQKIALMIPRFMNTDKLNANEAFYVDLRNAQNQFNEAHEWDKLSSVASNIQYAFVHDEGDKRRTNEEYDQIGIDWLEIVCDIADKHLGRHAHIDLSQYTDQMKSHPSQVKVNA